jgi:hypothetical protein
MNRSKFIRNSGTIAGAFFLSPQNIFAKTEALRPKLSNQLNGAGIKLKEVNTTSIEAAIDLGCAAISNCFDADDNNIPYFFGWALPEPRFGFHRLFSEAGVPGVRLEAILNADKAFGKHIDESAEQKLTKALFFSFSGQLALPLNRQKEKGRLVNFEPANLCENLSGLAALVKYRKSEKAQEIFEKCIDAIHDFWNPDHGWNEQLMKEKHGVTCHSFFGRFDAPSHVPFITSTGRALSALSVYYEVTHSAKALKLLTLLKDIAITEYFTSSGDYDPIRMGTHTSGITWILLCLARTASMMNDKGLMDRVKSFYDNGLNVISTPFGWSPEPVKQFNMDTEGLMNPARVLETGLILGRYGYNEIYQHCEQIIRGRLLPSQLRDITWIPPIVDTLGLDEYYNVAQRLRGSWGGGPPYGHQVKDDKIFGDNILFGGDVGGHVITSLSEAFLHATEYDGKQHKVNLLFDHRTSDIEVKSPYTHDGLRISPKRPGNILVRLPSWTKANEVKIRGGKVLHDIKNGYLNIGPNAAEIVIDFPLAKRELELIYRDEKIRMRLLGDQVLQMDNFGANLTFFDPYV